MAIERHLSVTHVADLLDCSAGHIYDLIAAKKLRSTDIGINRSKTRVPESEVERLLSANAREVEASEVATGSRRRSSLALAERLVPSPTT